MKFYSKMHGEFEYTNHDIIKFIKALPGFQGLNEFILVDLKDYQPFKLLQSLQNENIAFIVISPFDFFDKYEIKLNEVVLDDLNIVDFKEVVVLTTITLNSDPKKITTNLKAPIIINNSNNKARQVILEKSEYQIKHPLLKE